MPVGGTAEPVSSVVLPCVPAPADCQPCCTRTAVCATPLMATRQSLRSLPDVPLGETIPDLEIGNDNNVKDQYVTWRDCSLQSMPVTIPGEEIDRTEDNKHNDVIYKVRLGRLGRSFVVFKTSICWRHLSSLWLPVQYTWLYFAVGAASVLGMPAGSINPTKIF